MASVGVSTDKMKELRQTMLRMKIFEKDLREMFVRSSGPGGQNVNKVSTCVILRHVPTNIQVRSQQERSQGMNRYRARHLLIKKIEQKRRQERQKKIDDLQRKKRQTRKRSRALKEKILESKRQVSQKKRSRRGIRPHKIDDLL